MKILALYLMPFLLLLKKKKKNEEEQMLEKFNVKVAVIGGGCGYEKNLTITEDKIFKEEKSGNCDMKDTNSVITMQNETLSRLKVYLNDLDFKNLNINDCFRCRDGVDYVIELTENGKSYTNTIAFDLKETTEKDEQKMQEFLRFLRDL